MGAEQPRGALPLGAGACSSASCPGSPSCQDRHPWARPHSHGSAPQRSPEDQNRLPDVNSHSVCNLESPPSPLTFQRTEEVEKGIVGDLFGDCSDGASALMFLLFLDGFDCYIFSFLPVNGTPTGTRP